MRRRVSGPAMRSAGVRRAVGVRAFVCALSLAAVGLVAPATSIPASAATGPTGTIVYGRCTQGPSDTTGTTYRIKPDATGDVAVVQGGYPRVRPDGKRIAVRRDRATLATSALDGTSVHTFDSGTGSGFQSDPAWSPDGKKVAIAVQSGASTWQIRTYMDVTGGSHTTATQPADNSGIWSLDWRAGKWLMLFTRYHDGGPAPHRVIGQGAAGTTSPADVAEEAAGYEGVGNVRYRPDGTPSWYGSKGGAAGLYVNGSLKIPMASGGLREFAYSPDGKYVAVIRDYRPTSGMYLDLLSYADTPHFIRTLATGPFLCGVDWVPAPKATRKVSGSVKNIKCDDAGCRLTSLKGVTVTATGQTSDSTTTGDDGTWSLRLPKGPYSIKPSLDDRVFDPVTRTVTVATKDLTGVDFRSCGLIAPPPIEAARTGITATAVTNCTLSIDWQMPDRFHTDGAKYSAVDRLLTPAYATPDSWKVKVFVRVGSEARKNCAGYRFVWTISQPGGGNPHTETGKAGHCELATSVPTEGQYAVTVREERKGSSGWVRTGKNGAQTVIVQDWLIIAMGDSLASGEGNPDKPSPRAKWQYDRCHRSFFSWQAQVAARIEKDDAHTSVTMLHAGCSGASIEHIIGRAYSGMEDKDLTYIKPQLDQVRARLAGQDREVDAILLSIGVNDLVFGAVIKMCAEPNPACMGRTVKEVRDHDGNMTLKESSSSTLTVRAFEEAREAALPARYALLQAQLGDVDQTRVFIPAYPDLTGDEHGHTCDFTSPGTPSSWAFIRKPEAAWIGKTGDSLNAAIQVAADAAGWKFLGSAAGKFATHGYCSTDSWVQSPQGSLARQGNVDGAMHPIRKGPGAIADVVSDAVCQQLYKNKTGSCRYDPIVKPKAIRRPGTGSRLVP